MIMAKRECLLKFCVIFVDFVLVVPLQIVDVTTSLVSFMSCVDSLSSRCGKAHPLSDDFTSPRDKMCVSCILSLAIRCNNIKVSSKFCLQFMYACHSQEMIWSFSKFSHSWCWPA